MSIRKVAALVAVVLVGLLYSSTLVAIPPPPPNFLCVQPPIKYVGTPSGLCDGRGVFCADNAFDSCVYGRSTCTIEEDTDCTGTSGPCTEYTGSLMVNNESLPACKWLSYNNCTCACGPNGTGWTYDGLTVCPNN
jgi:hypothetical protein